MAHSSDVRMNGCYVDNFLFSIFLVFLVACLVWNNISNAVSYHFNPLRVMLNMKLGMVFVQVIRNVSYNQWNE